MSVMTTSVRRRFYEKPSEKMTREKAEAVRRARKQAVRDGLIAAPKKSQAQAGKAAAIQARAIGPTDRSAM